MPTRKFTLQIQKDPEATCRAAAEAFAAWAAVRIAAQGRFTAALSGGSTPRRMYQLLADKPLRGQVDWSKVIFFWGDERPVPPDDAQSNYRMAREALLEPLGIADSQVYRMPAELPNRDQAAQQYQNVLSDFFQIAPLGEPPSLDLVLLGLGPDAHTASLFPATPALLETRRWVVSNPVLKLNTERLTMTPMLINRAAQIYFLVTGAEKAKAVAEVLEGSFDTQRIPAQLIRPSQGQLTWFLDEAAASQLKQK